MKVIFIKELKKQGHVNEVKEVSDGYAINYLIKNGYAVKYTKTSSQILDEDIKKKEKEDAKCVKEALLTKEKIEKLLLEFKVKSNGNKVFGSINSKQISEELEKKGINVSKRDIVCEGLNSLGVHEVEIKLYKKVSAILRVNVVEK